MDKDVEARFARKLASNDLKIRNKTLRSLKKWMIARSGGENAFTELEMLKLWRGLYMCMWHSDKPLVQEELADSLASFIHVLQRRDIVLLFVKCFFSIISREWLFIDRLRLDKFYMLIRRMLRQTFQYLLDNNWDDNLVRSLVQILSNGPLNPDLSKTCSGVQLHVVEIFLPEFLTVAANSVPGDCSLHLLQPCCYLLANTRDPVIAEVIEARVLSQLVVGKKAKKLNVDCGIVSEELLQLAVSRNTVGRNRKSLYTLRQRLQEFAAEQENCDQSTEVDGREIVEREGEGKEEDVSSKDDGEEGDSEEEMESSDRMGDGSKKKKKSVNGDNKKSCLLTRINRLKKMKRKMFNEGLLDSGCRYMEDEKREGEGEGEGVREGEGAKKKKYQLRRRRLHVMKNLIERQRGRDRRSMRSRKRLREGQCVMRAREDKEEDGNWVHQEEHVLCGSHIKDRELIDSNHSNELQLALSTPLSSSRQQKKKRVSFGLYKNEIFTPEHTHYSR